MSFLDTNKRGFRWTPAPLQHSVSLVPGCARCGNRLEVNAQGIFALSGKCDNCMNYAFDGEEIIDELEY